MRNITIYAILLMAICTSCYRDIDLESYRSQPIVVLNSIITPDTVVMADISRSWFFTDRQPAEDIKGLKVELYINSLLKSVMAYNGNMYVSDVYPQPGDTVRIQTEVDGKTVSAEDVVPALMHLGDIKVTHKEVSASSPSYATDANGNITVIDKDQEFTYYIPFKDEANTKNYYFVRIEPTYRSQNLGTINYSYDPVFQLLSEQINGSMVNLNIKGQKGLPFSDQGIDGKEYTLTIKETGRINYYTGGLSCNRRIRLYSISEAYYRYLVSLQSNDSDQTLQGGMADIGIAEPVPIYSNVKEGTGILGCQQQEFRVIDIQPYLNK